MMAALAAGGVEMLDNLPDQKQKAFTLPAAVLDDDLLRPFGLDGSFRAYYYALAGNRTVALR
jgi:hypothetical protein